MTSARNNYASLSQQDKDLIKQYLDNLRKVELEEMLLNLWDQDELESLLNDLKDFY